MPPLSSPGCGPRRRDARPVEAAAELRYAHPERGIPRPGHADRVDGYRGGPTPENLVKSLAKGQQPTDLSTTGRLSHSDFCCRGLTATIRPGADGAAGPRQVAFAADGGHCGRSAAGRRPRKEGTGTVAKATTSTGEREERGVE